MWKITIFKLAYYVITEYNPIMLLKRKIYSSLLKWKEKEGKTALLVEGARRVGKSTIAEEFAKNEYKSYIIIDFSKCTSVVKNAFLEQMSHLDVFFQIMSIEYGVELVERNTLFIFDEVQLFPKAREAIKHLVADGRFDYLETGSLISIRENVENILIPSEEESVKMHPLDFEEFAWALGQEKLVDYIKQCFAEGRELIREFHQTAMRLFREYLIVGGMPASVLAYISKDIKSFDASQFEKELILKLYRSDIMKIDRKYRSRVISIYDQIPSLLTRHEKRVVFSEIEKGSRAEQYAESFFWLEDSMIANIAFNTSDPEIGLSLNEDRTYAKCYMGDTGLLLSHTFGENDEVDKDLYKELFLGRLSVNEGMFFENMIAQMLVTSGHKLFFYIHYDKAAKRNDIEIDFLISKGSRTKNKIYPIEVKSSENYSYKSLLKFIDKYKSRIGGAYVIHPRNYSQKDGITFLPCYMAFLL